MGNRIVMDVVRHQCFSICPENIHSWGTCCIETPRRSRRKGRRKADRRPHASPNRRIGGHVFPFIRIKFVVIQLHRPVFVSIKAIAFGLDRVVVPSVFSKRQTGVTLDKASGLVPTLSLCVRLHARIVGNVDPHMHMGCAPIVPNKRGALQTPIVPNTVFAQILI